MIFIRLSKICNYLIYVYAIGVQVPTLGVANQKYTYVGDEAKDDSKHLLSLKICDLGFIGVPYGFDPVDESVHKRSETSEEFDDEEVS